MTILPKKKNSKDKNESEATDHNHGSHSHSLQLSHTSTNETRDRGTRTRNSPPRWTLPSSRDEKRPAHSSNASYDDYDGLESGPSHSKRRHRASPLRFNRKHRINNHSGNNSPCNNNGTSTCTASGSATCSNSGSNASSSEDFSGYNSGDEYGPNVMSTEDEIEEAETMFESALKEKKGLSIKKMGEDGACLFRAVADQVYGDQEMHATVRNHCMDYMAKNSDYYSQYVTEDFETYIQRKRIDHIHGNHIEMQAMSEMYNRTIEVYQYSPEPINIFHGMHKTDNEPIRVSYHRNVHYNSVVDPGKATVGVGLGMPSFKPGSAEKKLMSDAIRQSEEFHIEQAMLEDKLRATDWEATNEAIEEQIARESYLQWLRDNEKRNRKTTSPRMPSATCSSATATSESGNSWWDNSNSPELRGWRSPRSSRSNNNSAANSPSRPSSNDDLINLNMEQSILNATEVGSSNYDLTQGACASLDPDQQTSPNGYSLLETTSLMNQLPPSVFGLTEWEDEAILAQVLAASQQEYLDCLKRNNTSKEFSSDCS